VGVKKTKYVKIGKAGLWEAVGWGGKARLPISLPTIALTNPTYCKINLTSDSELARFEMAYKWIKHGDGSYSHEC